MRFSPESHLDPLDAPKGPLDLRNVSFGQQDTLLQLRLRTFGDWSARDLESTGDRRLCVTITPAAGHGGGALCVVQREERPPAAGWCKHPKVRTVITSSHILEDTTARRSGYRKTWANLPSTAISRVFVIRDTPHNGGPQVACVRRAIAAQQPAGQGCSQPRSTSVPPDPNAAAARASRQKRVKVIDLTRFFCGKSRCMPVIGGALVRKDEEHMNSVFATTLGPYLLREINRYGAPQG